MNKEELLEDIKRHIDYTNAMNQKSMRDLQLENLFNYYNELQQKIDKAIEFIKEHNVFSFKEDDHDWYDYINKSQANDLLNLLEGKDYE